MKLLKSLFVVAVVAVLAVTATRSFFSDTEESKNNVFTAGAIDLTIDSECHYFQDGIDVGCYFEDGDGRTAFGTWESKDLVDEKFFMFDDVKPGDWGENTISLTINDNDAYACMYIENAENLENDLIDPEAEAGDVTELEGELAQNLHFTAWVDQGLTEGWQGDDTGEGDNVWQGPTAEPLLFSNVSGPASDVLGNKVYPLGMLVGGETNYIGVLWCAGELTIDGDAITCDGRPMGNESQTDSLSADVRFYVEQARNNREFVCPGLEPVVETRNISLENKDLSWNILSDDQIFGDIEYSHNDTTFNGVVTGQGLVPNGYYQITLNGPYDGCSFTNLSLGNFGSNTFQSGFWNSAWPNLSSTCTVNDEEGLYNMNLIGDHYTFQADGSGAFTYNFDLDLPNGDYSGVKVLVKKMLDTHVSPWADTGADYPAFNLYETAAINFTVL